MKKRLVLSWVVGLIMAAVVAGVAQADTGTVLVAGRAYQTNCSYYSAGFGDFRITYQNRKVSVDSIITLVYGFHDRFANQSWARETHVQMKGSRTGWQAEINAIQIDARGAFFFDEIEFAFEIRDTDGNIHWDNGGKAPLGYYVAPLPQRSCGTTQDFDWMPVDVR